MRGNDRRVNGRAVVISNSPSRQAPFDKQRFSAMPCAARFFGLPSVLSLFQKATPRLLCQPLQQAKTSSAYPRASALTGRFLFFPASALQQCANIQLRSLSFSHQAALSFSRGADKTNRLRLARRPTPAPRSSVSLGARRPHCLLLPTIKSPCIRQIAQPACRRARRKFQKRRQYRRTFRVSHFQRASFFRTHRC